MIHLVVKLIALLFLLAGVLSQAPAAVRAQLKVGFYDKTCPTAEQIVQQTVAAAFRNNSEVAPGLIRMSFHDCFVRGCDGSVLIDSTSNNTAEKDAPPNNPSLHGFEVIDAAKAAVEAKCPNIVSCADIIAFAARDSVNLSGNFSYKVPAGRRDGRISIAAEAKANLPSPLSNATKLINAFAAKNLAADDMVTLSGAHTIGVSHCSSFTNRLYNFSSTSQTDPTLSPAYARLLQSVCPANSSASANTTVFMDLITPTKLDNAYYVGLQLSLGLFTSDQALLTEANLSAAVRANARHPGGWENRFKKAMVKMGNIQVLTGKQGEIRKNCRVINSGSLESPLGVSDNEDGVEFLMEVASI
ncbi:Peroxidase 5 [Apostasia shenzhenica]|uniref:Peroxidase n=1 Tax=Apostasia shenzhenica TaxID=1088818 RepID=A0A2I0A029_9ASPA|nr:Peroxidase 5 [Apostasia shenzhenica]